MPDRILVLLIVLIIALILLWLVFGLLVNQIESKKPEKEVSLGTKKELVKMPYWLRRQAESTLAQADLVLSQHNEMVQRQNDYLATLKEQGVDQKILDKIQYIYRSPDLRFYAWDEHGRIPLGDTQ